MLTLLAFGCASPVPCQPFAVAPEPRDLSTLPALDPGNHLGVWPTYERLPPEQQDSVEAHRQQAREARMHVLIETVDSDGYALPKDLMAGEGYALAEGQAFDDPVITDRFACLLDVVLPELEGREVFAISVANEPDARLDDLDPNSADGLAWVEQLATFTAAAAEVASFVREAHKSGRSRGLSDVGATNERRVSMASTPRDRPQGPQSG